MWKIMWEHSWFWKDDTLSNAQICTQNMHMHWTMELEDQYPIKPLEPRRQSRVDMSGNSTIRVRWSKDKDPHHKSTIRRKKYPNKLFRECQRYECVQIQERTWRGINGQKKLTLCNSRGWWRAREQRKLGFTPLWTHMADDQLLTALKEAVWLFLDSVASENVSLAVSLAKATAQAALGLCGIPALLWIIIGVCDEHQNVFLLKPGLRTMPGRKEADVYFFLYWET